VNIDGSSLPARVKGLGLAAVCGASAGVEQVLPLGPRPLIGVDVPPLDNEPVLLLLDSGSDLELRCNGFLLVAVENEVGAGNHG